MNVVYCIFRRSIGIYIWLMYVTKYVIAFAPVLNSPGAHATTLFPLIYRLCGRGNGQFLQMLHEQLQWYIIREHGSTAILSKKRECVSQLGVGGCS